MFGSLFKKTESFENCADCVFKHLGTARAIRSQCLEKQPIGDDKTPNLLDVVRNLKSPTEIACGKQAMHAILSAQGTKEKIGDQCQDVCGQRLAQKAGGVDETCLVFLGRLMDRKKTFLGEFL